MPIIGKINPLPYENTVENMEIESVGYIDPDYLIVTKSKVFIPLATPVISLENWEESMNTYVKVLRIGSGLTEKDFEIDVSRCEKDTFNMEPDSRFLNLMKNKELYVIFSYSAEEKDEEVNEEEEETIQSMERKKQKALDEEDYKKAAELQKKINELKKTH